MNFLDIINNLTKKIKKPNTFDDFSKFLLIVGVLSILNIRFMILGIAITSMYA